MLVAYDSNDRAGLRGYVQFNKYIYIHTYILIILVNFVPIVSSNNQELSCILI